MYLTRRAFIFLAISGLSGLVVPSSAGAKRKSGGYMPSYMLLHETGELKRRGERLWQMMESCALCPRKCGARRLDGKHGFCGANAQLEVSAYHPHFGEERPLVGMGGSGTIFLTHCGLRCVFCCNWEISQGGAGKVCSIREMASMMIDLQRQGCVNINFVTPTQFSPHILLAIDEAAKMGLRLPVVYNTCGWERIEILKLLDGVVDIYLPDMKYAEGEMAARYSAGARTYPEETKEAVLEMHRQVGVAKVETDGLIYRGLMIRHLVMPNNVSGSTKVLDWIAHHLPRDTYVNIMSQYMPLYRAKEFPEIARPITREEYFAVVNYAKQLGFTNLDIQGWRR